ncbi:MAG: ABC transporter ATP-binding protein [Syntrophobacteraceae bacterium]|nr:ABC transporter ATP-binding protein/permease [Desulfobacteraceae bacterium]
MLKPCFKRYAPRVVFGFLMLMAVDFIQLVVPRIIKNAVDDLQHGTATFEGLVRYGVYIVLLALGIAVMRLLWRNLLLGFSRLVEMHLRNRMFAHILTLDRSFYQRVTAGEIMALATNDLSSVQLACGMGLVAFVDAVFMGFAAIAFMAYINPMLTTVAILPMPILALLTRLLASRVHTRFKKVQEQFSSITEFARSAFTSIRLLKAYNQEEVQTDRFNAMGETYVRNNLKLAYIYGTLFPISGLIGNVSMLLILYFGGKMTISGIITAGDFVAFISYLFLMTWPMMAMGWVADLFQRGVTSLGRINALLEEKPALWDPPALPEAAAASTLKGNILLRNLSFTYPGQRGATLRNIHLDIRAGQFIGVVGRTGAGKSTLCHLIGRLFPVDDGVLFFEGTDANELPLSAVREAIAYIPQDVVLFSDTIAFNISLGKPEASREDIEKVAKAAAIHDEISAMPDGYETRIGERGVKLSGGQRQRIAIARALLLDRPILMIDDALSAVDMETEHTIIRSIAGYLKDRTCIAVSHRVAPLADAREILVLEGGRIVARGNHEELLRRSRFYATIFRQQTDPK